jgi:sigma-B regulation protein RsbU (phosphoserine phosphatase)
MRVLIVEDDLATRLYLEGLLTKWGYHVTSVDDGERACEMLQQEDGPSLALLDWELPGMDGVEICRRVRSRVRGRPVYLVLLTGRAQRVDVVHGLEAGADDYLTKPFDHAELRSRLRVGERVLDMAGQLQERVAELVQALGRVKQLEAIVAGSTRL